MCTVQGQQHGGESKPPTQGDRASETSPSGASLSWLTVTASDLQLYGKSK